MSFSEKLQEKYNDWRDKGRHAVNFFAKNKLLDDKHDKLCKELEKNYQALQEKRQKDPQERLKIIRKRLENYGQRKNDPCAYFHGEIDEVRTLLQHAATDLEFLLKEIDLLKQKLEIAEHQLFQEQRKSPLRK